MGWFSKEKPATGASDLAGLPLPTLLKKLSDATDFSKAGKTAAIKIERAREALHQIIPLLKKKHAGAVPNFTDLERHFSRVLRAAGPVEMLQKALAIDDPADRLTPLQEALDLIEHNHVSDQDLAEMKVVNPKTGKAYTREALDALVRSQR